MRSAVESGGLIMVYKRRELVVVWVVGWALVSALEGRAGLRAVVSDHVGVGFELAVVLIPVWALFDLALVFFFCWSSCLSIISLCRCLVSPVVPRVRCGSGRRLTWSISRFVFGLIGLRAR